MYPMFWHGKEVWIGMLLFTKLRKFTLICLSLRLSFVGAKPMIKVMDHFSFIKRQIRFVSFVKNIALKSPTVRLQLMARVKQMGIGCHMKHHTDFETPRIFF